jgi:hypothetical protein
MKMSAVGQARPMDFLLAPINVRIAPNATARADERLPTISDVRQQNGLYRCCTRGLFSGLLSAPNDAQATELQGFLIWSGRRESNPRMQLGKLPFYH